MEGVHEGRSPPGPDVVKPAVSAAMTVMKMPMWMRGVGFGGGVA